ncbi:MAG: hypothetical protein M3O02_02505 [Acidobacteriota bacterium]|nr:hypothetical protein [Acidobacteriota bacterium]
MWRAQNQTARSITGDIALTPDKLTINFIAFSVSRIRALEAGEIAAAFNPDPASPPGTGSLYRIDIPATRKFLRKNTLCGADDTTWMVTLVAGRSLEIVFLSGAKPPSFRGEGLANSPDLCGTYLYTR